MSDLNPLRNDEGTLPDLVKYIRKELGVKLSTLILGVNSPTLKSWTEGKALTQQHKRFVFALHYVVATLRTVLDPMEAKIWLVSHSDYLYGIPAKELRMRPEDVKYAAENRISRGEYYDTIHERMEGGEQ